jgi:RHS repeat-associated protein
MSLPDAGRRSVRLLSATVALLTVPFLFVPPAVAAPPPEPRTRTTPAVPPGPGPVDRALPASSRPGHGLPAGERPPAVPPGSDAAGAPRRLSKAERQQAAKPTRQAALSTGPGAYDLLLRPGFAMADTSLVLYFEADASDIATWQTWRATVYDATTGTAQESAPIAASDLTRCATPRQFCRTFGAADGWVLTDARDYSVTVTVTTTSGGRLVSERSGTAKARTTALPPVLPAAQISGCSCGTALAPADGPQAMRGAGVATGAGALNLGYLDLRMAGFGVPFQALRRYSSGNTADGSLGIGWAWTYDVRVVPPAAGQTAVTVRADDGAAAVYQRNSDGSYQRPPAVRSTLSASGSGWKLVTPDQITYAFDAAGRLTSVKDPRGNGATLAYTATAWTITDAAGRAVAVSLGADGLIRRITLPDGRFVEYGYTGRLLTSVTDAVGSVWRYAYAGGLLTEVIDPAGRTQVTTAYTNGRVTSQADAYGKLTTFSWDAARQEARTVDPDGVDYYDGYRGNVLVYRQNGNGDTVNKRYNGRVDPTLLVDAKGNQLVSGFDAAGNLTRMTAPEPFGYTVSNTFDPRNNLTAHTDGLGHTSTFGYTAFDELNKITTPTGKTTVITVDDRGLATVISDPRGKKTSMAYDAAGNLVSRTSPLGFKTVYGYDGAGRPTTETDPRGTAAGADPDDYTTRRVYDGLDRLRQSFEPGKTNPWITDYDALGQLSRSIDPEGGETTYAYLNVLGRTASVTDPNGELTAYAYTAAGRRSAVTDPAGAKTTMAYDSRGNLSSVVSPRGNVSGANPALFTTTYTYDFNSNLVRARHPYPGGGFVTKDTGFDELNRATTSTDGFGKVTTTRFDNNHNAVSTVDPLGGQTTLAYDADGLPTVVTAPTGGALRTEYDAAGNPTARTFATGGRTTWTYDDDGRVVTAVEPRGNAAGANPADYTSRYTYDPAGNLTSAVDALGTPMRFGYDASNRVVSTTDRNGNTTGYTYDQADRLTAVVAPGDGNPTTRYAYDAAGHLVRRTDPNGHLGEYTYDETGRVASVTDGNGRVGTYSYDAEGNLVRYTAPGSSDAASRSIVNTYDILNRHVGQDQRAGGLIYAYGYDAESRMTGMADPAGIRTMAYDANGRLTRAGRDDGSFTYGYDRNGNVTSRVWPDGTTLTAAFDGDNRMTGLTADGTTNWTFGYDAAGRPTRTTMPGAETTRTYDRAGRLSDVRTAAGSAVLARYQLVRDPVGNPTTVTTTRGTDSQAVGYSYDPMSRVTAACYNVTSCSASSSDTVRYGYDAVGNRTSQTLTGTAGTGTTSYTYDSADQLLSATTGSSTVAYEYDGRGNMTRAGGNRFTYNLDHTMATATVGGRQVSFDYDGQGLRLSAVSGSGADITSRSWRYDINNEVPQLALDKVDYSTSATSRGYVSGPGELPLATLRNGHAESYALDFLGGVGNVVSTAGKTLAAFDYDPYGNARDNGTADGLTVPGSESKLGFTGAYLDSQLGGQYSFPARTYDPATGRFGGKDPVAPSLRAPATSTYGYVEGRPTVLRDPSGASANSDHDAAQALALQQLDARYGAFNVYADDVAGRQTLQGNAGRIRVPTVNRQPGQPKTGYPDIIARVGDITYVWEVKPAANQAGRIRSRLPIREIQNLNQINRYVAGLAVMGDPPTYPNVQKGPDIVPASQTDAKGVLTIFSRAHWDGWAGPRSNKTAVASNADGIIYYRRIWAPRTPTPKPRQEPAPTDRPGSQPSQQPATVSPGTVGLVAVGVVGVAAAVVFAPEIAAIAAIGGAVAWLAGG